MAELSKAQKARLGTFLATGIGVFILAFVLLAGQAMVEDRDAYTIRFSNKHLSFSGLEPGSSVKYSGIKVGRVESLRIDPQDVSIIEVGISLSGKTPVAEDSTASLGSMGITGLKFVELSRGSAEARVRAPGEEIPAGESMLDELSARALSIADRLEDTLKNIQAMTDQANQERIARLLDSTATMLEDNQDNFSIIATNLSAASTSGNEMMEELSHFASSLESTRGRLDRLLITAEGSLGKDGITGTVIEANALLKSVNLMVRRNQLVFDSTLKDLRTSAENLSDLTQNVKDQPSLLFRTSKTGGDDLMR